MEHLLLHSGMICIEWLCYYLQEYTQSTLPMIKWAQGIGREGNENNHGKMAAASKLVSKPLTWLGTGLNTCQLQGL